MYWPCMGQDGLFIKNMACQREEGERKGEKWWVELGRKYGWGGQGKYSHTVALTHTDHNIRGAVNTHTWTYLAKCRDHGVRCSPLGSHPLWSISPCPASCYPLMKPNCKHCPHVDFPAHGRCLLNLLPPSVTLMKCCCKCCIFCYPLAKSNSKICN